MLFYSPTFGVLVVILSVLAVSTKDSASENKNANSKGQSTNEKPSASSQNAKSSERFSFIEKAQQEQATIHKHASDFLKENLRNVSTVESRKGKMSSGMGGGFGGGSGFRGGKMGGGGDGSELGGGKLWNEFWSSLYVDRTFNSSFALNIPLFTITIPGYGRGVKSQTPLSALNVGNLAVLGIVVLGGMALVAPLIFPEPFKRSMERSFNREERQGITNFLTSRLVGVSESIMGWVERSVDDLPSFPRLDAQECMKRCICEAHNQPKKYGMSGLLLQLFFPPYTEAEEPLKVVSKYQLAARYGRTDKANCAAQYDGCMVNFLDIIQGVINLVL